MRVPFRFRLPFLVPAPFRVRVRQVATAVATAALALLAAGCDPGPPDGKERVLFFDHDRSFAEVGGSQRIVIPRRKTIGGYVLGRGLPYRKRTFEFDFAGTRLEVEVPPGAAVLTAGPSPEGYAIVVHCDAPVQGTLRVRILAGDRIRYADATFLECR